MTLAPYVPFIRGIIYLVAGYLIAKLTSKTVARLLSVGRRPRNILLIRKALFYTILALFIISALRQWGFELNVLLGATGLITVAVGFASQNVVANIVGGLFLLAEESFQLDDIIEINGIKGKIISIDSFSIRIKQESGAIVRLPNDLLIKTPVTNLSRQKD